MKTETKFHLRGEIQSGRVWLNHKELHPTRSQNLINHSPDGFSWGYNGSGPAQLALAICLELFGQKVAKQIYQDFKFQLISNIDQTDFSEHFIWEW